MQSWPWKERLAVAIITILAERYVFLSPLEELHYSLFQWGILAVWFTACWSFLAALLFDSHQAAGVGFPFTVNVTLKKTRSASVKSSWVFFLDVQSMQMWLAFAMGLLLFPKKSPEFWHDAGGALLFVALFGINVVLWAPWKKNAR